MVAEAYTVTEIDRVDIRCFAGYPPYGTGVVVFPEPWVFTYYLAFETRLNNLVETEAAVVQSYLQQIRQLEAAVPTAGGNLDTDRAAVWTHNKSEVRDRMALYRRWRVEMCSTLGIPPGPHLRTKSRERSCQ